MSCKFYEAYFHLPSGIDRSVVLLVMTIPKINSRKLGGSKILSFISTVTTVVQKDKVDTMWSISLLTEVFISVTCGERVIQTTDCVPFPSWAAKLTMRALLLLWYFPLMEQICKVGGSDS